METITFRLRQQYPESNNNRFNKVVSLHNHLVGETNKSLWLLFGAVTFVLLIACANVANLLLVRAEGRQQELSIRAALGAGWGRIAREMLIESLTLGVAGCVVALGLAYGALAVLRSMAPANLPRRGRVPGRESPAGCPRPSTFRRPPGWRRQ